MKKLSNDDIKIRNGSKPLATYAGNHINKKKTIAIFKYKLKCTENMENNRGN